MPEGPEIRAVADKIATSLVGHKLTEVFFAFETLKEYEEQLTGEVVQAVEARGKALLIRFGNGLNIYTHSLLYGRWYFREAQSFPKTGRTLRLALHTKTKSALLYSASSIEVLRDEDVDEHRYLAALGPDVLQLSTRPAAVLKRFKDKRFNRRPVSKLLLDQAFLCGPGNYLRSEILFVSKVSPFDRALDLDDKLLGTLSKNALAVSRRAYETGGITCDAKMVAKLVAKGLPRRHYRHYVYGRTGQPCRRCGTEIQRDTIDGRGVFFCPECQPALKSSH